jgi:hypothetical protein
VRIYNDHLRTNHPAFRHWKRKLSATYPIPILLLFAGGFMSIWFAIPPSGVNFAVALPFWLAAILVGLASISVRRRGTRKFRQQWIQEHANANP